MDVTNRRSTRIPLPPVNGGGAVAPTGPVEPAALPVNPSLPPNMAGKPGPIIAVHRRNSSPTYSDEPGTPMGMEESWESVVEQTGWTVADCLNHKLMFKKREDPKIKTASMSTHIKRLRAAGRHLSTLYEKQELDIEALKSALDAEEAGRREERSELEATIRQLREEVAELKDVSEGQGEQLEQLMVDKQRLSEEAGASSTALHEAVSKLTRAEEDRNRLQQKLDEAEAQSRNLTELHQQAQKYQSQLQDYNSKLQADVQGLGAQIKELQGEKDSRTEENAQLRGKVSALEAQVESLQVAEAAARELAGDAARVKAELGSTTEERDRLRTELDKTSKDLDKIRELSGSSVEQLESTRRDLEVLESRSKAQAQISANLTQELAVSGEKRALAEALAEERGIQLRSFSARVGELQERLEGVEAKLSDSERTRRKLHNQVLELKGNIRVFCRVRPSLQAEAMELPSGEPVCSFVDSGEFEGRGVDMCAMHPDRGQLQRFSFAFDRVFGPKHGQGVVFEEIEQLVQSALDGYKVCIFAYGQTGSGKTHTMLGRPGDHGMIPRAMDFLFATSNSMQKQGWQFEMRAAMLEIYNEEYKDLLGRGPPQGKKHQVTHSSHGTSVSYLEWVDVGKPQRVASLLASAMQQRAVGATAVNEHSSRSHFVFMLQIDGTNEMQGTEVHGMINLIDLAGSERLSRSLATGDRLKETQNINKSLSALGDVIMALAKKEQHVPYRNSKLTYLLQQCLGGDAKTLMFVNIAPSLESAQESLCSLRFASKVNACEIGVAKRNTTPLSHSRTVSSIV